MRRIAALVLEFSRALTFRHPSIPDGIARFQAIAAAEGWTIDATEDPCAFNGHPAIQAASLVVEDPTHVSTAHLTSPFSRTDEWNNFVPNPRTKGVHVLLTIDETSYIGGAMGDHPMAWCHDFDGGRSWYTGGGHRPESYAEPDFIEHLRGGLEYALGVGGTC